MAERGAMEEELCTCRQSWHDEVTALQAQLDEQAQRELPLAQVELTHSPGAWSPGRESSMVEEGERGDELERIAWEEPGTCE